MRDGKAQRDDQQVLMVHHACHCGSKYRPYQLSLGRNVRETLLFAQSFPIDDVLFLCVDI